MATFALIHGGGSTGWDWHLVVPLLERSGHTAFAVDLPIEDDAASLEDYADAVVDAVGDREHVIVVGHSLGGMTVPLAAARLDAGTTDAQRTGGSRVDGLVYLSAMIPSPGEIFGDWWVNTGYDREEDGDPFFNGVPDALAWEAQARERDQKGEWMSRPWPGTHPDLPTLAILCRDDRFFPPQFMRRLVRERLGSEPVEIPGGHYATLSEPLAVATALDDFARRISADT